MKALVKMAPGAGNWQVIEKPEPTINDDQVKIQVEYIGVCGSDIHTYEGHYNVNAQNLTIGHEFAGIAVEVGKNVKHVKVGDKVTSETTFEVCETCRYCQAKEYNLCSHRKGLGTQQDGACANYIVARGASVHVLPINLSCKEAAITEAAACAHHGVEKAKIFKNDIVLVLGPGPIGLLVAQVVKAKGGKVVMTGLTKDMKRLKTAKAKFGVDYIVDVQTQDVKEIVDALEIRAYLESLAFTLLIQQDIDLRPLEANLYYMEQLAERPNFDLNEFGQSHLNFHTEMVQLSGNTFLVGLYDRMHLGALQRIFFYPMTYDELQTTHNEHCKIFDYIKTKNPEGEAFIKQHLWKLRDSIATSDVLSHM